MLGTALIGASCLSFENDLLENVTSGVILPKRLKRGDKIGICAPAGPIRDISEVNDFVQVLKDLGFKVKIGKNVTGQFGFFSADDKARAEEFMELVEDETLQGIFSIRGGWGCARMIEFLDFDVIQKNQKVIMGFSDMTTLLNAISSKTGLITYHGPSGNSTWNDYSVDYIKRLLLKAEPVIYRNTSPLDAGITTLSPGKASGALYGGNLSVISSLVGSDYLPDWKGKILFLEDVNEEPYRIDRMLTQLALAGVFSMVNGIILGGFRKCYAEEPDRSFTIEEVFEQHFTQLKIPVYSGAQIGHIRNKYTVPVGLTVHMNADEGTFHLEHPAVF
jgi:muramoyltetrapeptide carboxypeptidase